MSVYTINHSNGDTFQVLDSGPTTQRFSLATPKGSGGTQGITPNNGSTFNAGIVFPGDGSTLWGEVINENILKIFENFASLELVADTPDPDIVGVAIGGQLWFNITPGNEHLYVFDGSIWQKLAFFTDIGSAIAALPDFIDSSGDTMTGFLTLNADPTLPLHAATKQFVEGLVNGLSASLVLHTTDLSIHRSINDVGTGTTDLLSASKIISLITASVAVDSIFGRTGAVIALPGDYTGSQITNIPAGSISSTNVQAAINELDTDATTHSGNLAIHRQINDAGTGTTDLLSASKILSLSGGGGGPAILTTVSDFSSILGGAEIISLSSIPGISGAPASAAAGTIIIGGGISIGMVSNDTITVVMLSNVIGAGGP